MPPATARFAGSATNFCSIVAQMHNPASEGMSRLGARLAELRTTHYPRLRSQRSLDCSQEVIPSAIMEGQLQPPLRPAYGEPEDNLC